jgi:hypothetical protein
VNSSVNTHLGALAIAAISLKHNRESANHAQSGLEDEHSNVRSWTLLLPATLVTSRVRKTWHAIGHPTLHKHV